MWNPRAHKSDSFFPPLYPLQMNNDLILVSQYLIDSENGRVFSFKEAVETDGIMGRALNLTFEHKDEDKDITICGPFVCLSTPIKTWHPLIKATFVVNQVEDFSIEKVSKPAFIARCPTGECIQVETEVVYGDDRRGDTPSSCVFKFYVLMLCKSRFEEFGLPALEFFL